MLIFRPLQSPISTRIYPASGAVPISPAVAAGWEHNDPSFARYLADTNPANYTGMTATGSGSGVANEDTIAAQMIFGPVAAQTISGNVKGQFAGRELNVACDARIQGTIRVIGADGTTVRGTLLALDGSALAHEFGSVQTNTFFPLGGAAALSSVVALDGDYIVIELGFRNHGTDTSGVRVIAPATPVPNGDLPEDETTTPITGYRGWVEFSQQILLFTGPTFVETGTGVDTFSGGSISPTVTESGAGADALTIAATTDLGSGSLWIGRFINTDAQYTISNEILSYEQVDEGQARVNIVSVDGQEDSWTEYDRGDLVDRDIPINAYLDLLDLKSVGDVRQRATEELEKASGSNSPGGGAVWRPVYTRLDHIFWISEDNSKYETRIEGLTVEFDQSSQPFQRATIDTGVMVFCPPDAVDTYIVRDLFDRTTSNDIGTADIGGAWKIRSL